MDISITNLVRSNANDIFAYIRTPFSDLSVFGRWLVNGDFCEFTTGELISVHSVLVAKFLDPRSMDYVTNTKLKKKVIQLADAIDKCIATS